MNESKIDLCDRLRREKRWEEGARFKDAHAKKLRDNGVKRGEANEAAWQAMAEKFPLIETPETSDEKGPVDDFTPEQIAGLPPGSLKNFSGDVSWVYSNLEGDADIGSAPSAEAAGLLRWACENRNDFYGKILPKALQVLEKRPDQDAADAEMERLNREHSDNLFERAMGRKWMEDHNEEFNAVHELKEAKGFTEDTSGFAAYLRGLIEE